MMSSPSSEWYEIEIDQLGRVVTGNTPSTKRSEFYGDKYPFITPSDLDFGSRTVQTERFLSEKGKEEVANRLLPADAVCFTSIGATIGKMCMATRPSVTNQQINSIVVDKTQHDPRFVYYLLCHNTEQIKALAGGVATPIVSKSKFSQVKVSVPPLPTQHKIAAILSAYDDLIENNARRIAILEEMAQAIYREWFVHFRFPGHERVEMVDSELGPIPKGWEVILLTELVDFVRGVEPGSKNYLESPTEETIPFLRVGDFGSRQSEIYIPGALAKGRILDRRDVAITLDGTVGIVKTGLSGGYSSGIRKVVVRDGDRLNSSFSYYLLQSDHIQAIIRAHAKGTTILHAGSAVNHMNLALPSGPIMRAFDHFVSPLMASMLNLQERNVLLRCTRDLLLPRLISGELDASDLPIDVGGLTA